MSAQVIHAEFGDIPPIPEAVARQLIIGDPREAAESLARLDLNEEAEEHEVAASLARIAPHLDEEAREREYVDLKVRLGEFDDAYAGDSQDAQHDAWARVDTALQQLVGGA